MAIRVGHGFGAQGDFDRALEEHAGDEGDGTMSAVSTNHVVDLVQSNVASTLAGMSVSTSIQKLIAVGEGTGIVLSEAVLVRMGVKCGDALCVEETSAGVHLTPRHAGVSDQIGLADELMRENRDVLGRLAR